MCPECGSEQVTVSRYDFGVCPQTGYHDAGERFHCQACGATGDAGDLCPRVAELLGPSGPKTPARYAIARFP